MWTQRSGSALLELLSRRGTIATYGDLLTFSHQPTVAAFMSASDNERLRDLRARTDISRVAENCREFCELRGITALRSWPQESLVWTLRAYQIQHGSRRRSSWADRRRLRSFLLEAWLSQARRRASGCDNCAAFACRAKMSHPERHKALITQ